MDQTKEFFEVASLFVIEGEIESIEPYGEGHINKTYLVVTTKKRYILQPMNTGTFPDSDGLMRNICGVTEHLRARGIEAIEVIPTLDGKSYIKGEKCYRMYAFIEDTVSYQIIIDERRLSLWRHIFRNEIWGTQSRKMQNAA